jgi:hypothetical protein
LAASAGELARSLERFQTGEGWRKHLALPDDVLDADGADQGTGPDRERLAKVLTRFDAISRNPEYRVIAQLQEFQATHEALSAYVGQLGPSPVEEIPPPPGASKKEEE